LASRPSQSRTTDPLGAHRPRAPAIIERCAPDRGVLPRNTGCPCRQPDSSIIPPANAGERWPPDGHSETRGQPSCRSQWRRRYGPWPAPRGHARRARLRERKGSYLVSRLGCDANRAYGGA
jgi:hypothetical protein